MNPPLFDDKNSPTFDNITIAVTEKITGICTSNDRIQIAVSNGCVRRIEHVSVSTVSIIIKLLIYRVFVFKVGTELVKNSNLSEPGGSVTDATSGDGTESSDTSDYDALVNEVLDSISAQIDDIVGNYTSGDDKEGDDS